MKKFIKVNLIILVIFSLITLSVFADEPNDTSENNEKSESKKLEDLKLEKEELVIQEEESNSQLEFISEEISETVAEVSELSQKIYDKQTEIEEFTAKTEIIEKRILKVRKQLLDATDEYNNQKDLLEKRLVAMYEMGETSYLDLLLNSKGISDFLSNYYYISEIATTDSQLLNIVNNQKKKIEKMMIKLEEYQFELIMTKSDLEKASIAISNMIIIKNQRLEELSDEELSIQREIEEYQNEIQKIESEIRLLSLSSNNENYVGGVMQWPVPGYTRISSPFGMRTHPITGVYKLHTGTDISAPMGAMFVAANDGIVTKAGMNAAYGNMVIIDHGGGITTLYAHGSEIMVQEGQIVKQGEQVLKVGSTGYSTGPHAHFEIRINGQYVNPLDYLDSDKFDNKEETSEIEIVELNEKNNNEEEKNAEE